ncbi:MAG: BT_3987 domain-containing protein [Candidatus Cryptobacteroides sp.]
MKKIYPVIIAAFAFTACNDALNPVLQNAFYISEASQTNVAKRILNEVDGTVVSATVRCASLLEEDVDVTITLSQEVLDEYNRRNGTSLVMLPEGSHDFVEQTLTVKAGQSQAPRLNISVKPYTAEMLASGFKYALPLSISKVSDGTPCLEVKKSMIYVFDQVIITNGFQINAASGAEKVLNNPFAGNEYTVELRVAPLGLNKENEAFLMIYPDQDPVDEGYGQVYCRFQKDNSLNIKVLSNENFTWSGPLSRKWYHVALVSLGDGNLLMYVNGVEVLRENKPSYANLNHLEKVTLGSASTVWHTNSYCYSEVRLWSKVRSASQIQDNMYSVDPHSEGLELYWKCDEGEGNVIKDYTGKGNDLNLDEDVVSLLPSSSAAWGWVGPIRSDSDEILF